MKPLYLLLFLLPLMGISQEYVKPNSFIIKTNLTSTIDVFSFPTINISAEKRVAHNVSIAGEFGYQFYGVRKVDTAFITPNGYKANIECRFYHLFTNDVRKINTLTGGYLGINFFYRSNENNLELSYYPGSNGGNIKKDCLWASRNIYGSNVVLGYQGRIMPGIVIDSYVGLGIMNRTSVNHNREYNSVTDSLYIPVDYVMSPVEKANLTENNGWKVSLTFGMRIGIKIK